MKKQNVSSALTLAVEGCIFATLQQRQLCQRHLQKQTSYLTEIGGGSIVLCDCCGRGAEVHHSVPPASRHKHCLSWSLKERLAGSAVGIDEVQDEEPQGAKPVIKESLLAPS